MNEWNYNNRTLKKQDVQEVQKKFRAEFPTLDLLIDQFSLLSRVPQPFTFFNWTVDSKSLLSPLSLPPSRVLGSRRCRKTAK